MQFDIHSIKGRSYNRAMPPASRDVFAAASRSLQASSEEAEGDRRGDTKWCCACPASTEAGWRARCCFSSGGVIVWAWLVSSLYISFGGGAPAGDIDHDTGVAERLPGFFLNFVQVQIFAEAYSCIWHSGDTDYFHTLRLMEAILESAPNSLVQLYALVIWAIPGGIEAEGATALLQASVFSSFVSVGLGLAMWEQKVQFRTSAGYIATVAVMRAFEIAARSATLAVQQQFSARGGPCTGHQERLRRESAQVLALPPLQKIQDMLDRKLGEAEVTMKMLGNFGMNCDEVTSVWTEMMSRFILTVFPGAPFEAVYTLAEGSKRSAVPRFVSKCFTAREQIAVETAQTAKKLSEPMEEGMPEMEGGDEWWFDWWQERKRIEAGVAAVQKEAAAGLLDRLLKDAQTAKKLSEPMEEGMPEMEGGDEWWFDWWQERKRIEAGVAAVQKGHRGRSSSPGVAGSPLWGSRAAVRGRSSSPKWGVPERVGISGERHLLIFAGSGGAYHPSPRRRATAVSSVAPRGEPEPTVAPPPPEVVWMAPGGFGSRLDDTTSAQNAPLWGTPWSATSAIVMGDLHEAEEERVLELGHRPEVRELVRALQPYAAQTACEMTLNTWDYLEIVQRHPTGWTFARKVGALVGKSEGWFPDWVTQAAEDASPASDALQHPLVHVGTSASILGDMRHGLHH
ncbi:unnamed protein product [Symbiodinium sp. CCMP2592]|nr:unnamed protein product [Symbiodinium sp. CCMP2592]